MKNKNLTIKVISIWLLLTIIFMVLMIATYLIPDSLVMDNVIDSANTLVSEGSYPKKGGIISNQLDNYTDAYVLNFSIHQDGEPIRSAFINPHYENRGVANNQPKARLLSVIDGAGKKGNAFYGRYWQGYLVIIRPLLTILKLKQIYIIFEIVFLITLSILLYMLVKEKKTTYGIALLLSLTIVKFWINWQSTKFYFCFLVALLASIYVIKNKEKLFDEEMLIFFFVIGGIIVFLDYFYVPLITLVIPLTILIILNHEKIEQMTVKQVTIGIGKLILAWLSGWLLLWLSKAILYVLFYGDYSELLNVMFMRIGKWVGGKEYRYATDWLLGLRQVIIVFAPDIAPKITLLLLGLSTTVPAIILKNKTSILLFTISCLFYVWCIVFSRSVEVHAWAVYRNVIIVLFPAMCQWIMLIKKKRLRVNNKKESMTMRKIKNVLIKLLVVMMFVGLVSCSNENNYVTFAKISQKNKNYRDILINLNDDAYKDAKSIKVKATLDYNNKTMYKVEETLDINDEVVFEVPYFGEWNIDAKLQNEKGKTIARQKDVVDVTASEYNIAPLIASLPVLIFSLKYFSDLPTKTENGDPIPTVVTLARDNQYDWDNLPENMYKNPYLTDKDKGKSDYSVLNVQMPMISDYVRKLYELDNTSKFNFYINDQHFAKVAPQLIYANQIPEDNYRLTFITDGSSSYAFFKQLYDRENAAQKHQELIEEFKEEREKWKSGEEISPEKLEYGRYYVYAALDVEKDSEWWVIRKSAADTFKIQDEEFLKTVIDDSRVSNNYINGLLAKVEENGKSEELKALYKFEDEAYKTAAELNKKPLMILGSSVATEHDSPVDEYIKITKALYGDEYLCIYKGHPGNIPTEQRVGELEELKVEIVDASIAAELFMFYHPETILAGYPSTTFVSAESKDNCLSLYLLTKNQAHKSTTKLYESVKGYAELFDSFISRLPADKNELPEDAEVDIRIYDVLPNPDHHYYLIEYNPIDETRVSLWDVDTQELTHYVLQDDGYKIVE